MRHQSFQPDMPGRADGLQNLRCRGARSQPSHAAVDFQMIVARDAPCRRQPIPLRDIGQRMDHRRQVVVQKAGSFGRQKIRHHQNARRDAAVPQDGSFLYVAHRQPARPGGLQRARNLHRSVPVSVGLHHRHHFHLRPHHLANRAEVFERFV